MIIILTAILEMIHGCLVDSKMYSRMPDQKDIREKYWYLLGDGVYLGGKLVMFLLVFFIGRLTAEMPILLTCQQLAIGILIGSVTWDLGFGYIVDRGQFFYPYKDWYGGWGFENKTNRILFDSCRILLAVLIYITTFIKL